GVVMKSWALVAVSVSLALAACSSSSNTGSGSGSGGSAGAGGGTGNTGNVGSPSSGPGSPTSSSTTASGNPRWSSTTMSTSTMGPVTSSTGSSGMCDVAGGTGCDACPAMDPSAACTMDPTMCMDCATCCINGNMNSYNTLLTDFVNDCACAAGSPCSTQCTDICGGGMPGDPCIMCLNGLMAMEACLQQAGMECVQDATCSPVLACFQTCPQM